MGGMKRNGRDFGMTDGRPDGPDFSAALYALFDLCSWICPQDLRGDGARKALEKAQAVLDGWSDYLPYVPTEEEALADEWRSKGDAR